MKFFRVYYLLDTEKGWGDNGSFGYFKVKNKEELYNYLKKKKHLDMYCFEIEEIEDFNIFEKKREEDIEMAYAEIKSALSTLEHLQKVIEVE